MLYSFIETDRNALELKKCQKIGVGRVLGEANIKNLLAHRIPNKILEKKMGQSSKNG